MSRKKIVAATMIAAALGLAIAGYTATRANGTSDVPEPLRALPLKADAGYRQNHQIGHNGAVFEWMDTVASLDHSQDNLVGERPAISQDPAATETDEDELTPVAVEHANRVGPGTFAGFGLAGGAAGGTPKGGDEWSGGRYASSFGGYGGFGGIFGGGGGGGSPSTHTKGSSGTNDPSSDKPHTDAPALSNNGTGDQPGTNEPQGPVNPPAEQKNPDTTVTPPSVEPEGPVEPEKPEGPQPPPTTTNPPGDHPATNVPEPATLGLLGFGMIAAAALRRRRRS